MKDATCNHAKVVVYLNPRVVVTTIYSGFGVEWELDPCGVGTYTAHHVAKAFIYWLLALFTVGGGWSGCRGQRTDMIFGAR